MVDAVITVPDDDKGSACGAIEKCLEIADEVIFCNGGCLLYTSDAADE